jgi:uncharacterized protein YcbX
VRVTELNVYPVKSTRGLRLPQAVVQPWGLADDRRWMVVDDDGVAITARTSPALLGVTATPQSDGRLRLAGPHAPPLDVDGRFSSEPVSTRVWSSHVQATWVSAAADAWFAKLLGRDVLLVWLDDPARRPVNPRYGRAEDRVSFADAFPLLLTTTGSLRQLNDWITQAALDRGEPAPDPLPMSRFRPGVVVGNDEPFAEDDWRLLRIGGVRFRAVKLCDRCVLTTIDPDTQTSGPEPIRTLARHRRWDGKVWFGVNIIPDDGGTIHVGDPVHIDAPPRK